MSRYQYRTTNGTEPREMTEERAEEIIGDDRTASAYDDHVYLANGGGATVDVQVYEVYGSGETPEDHPDGDPYAEALWVLPDGYVWSGGSAIRGR